MTTADIIWNLVQMLLDEKEKSRKDESTNDENDECKELHNH